MNPDQSVTHFAATEKRKQQQDVMCGYISPGDAVTTAPAAVTCQDCRDWIGPTDPPPAFKLEDPASPNRPQNMVDPSLPPPRSATLEEIAEATRDVPRRPRVGLIGHYGPQHVMAIAASLAAEFPGMFDGDVLRPLRVPPPLLPAIDYEAQATVDRLMHDRLERGITRQIAAEAHPVVIDSVPPLEKRPGHRSGYRVGLTTKGGGKPSGSKLARKAARGKL